MNTHSLYIMISNTNTGVGKLIRKRTKYPYSHVSLTLNPSMREWVSFARFQKETVFAAGFVVEDIQRFASLDTSMQVRIFQIPITDDNYEKLSSLFALAGKDRKYFLYNLFDAFLGAFRHRFRIPGCYTCIGFANAILGTDFIWISELADYLKDYSFYEGNYWDLVQWEKPDPNNNYLQPVSFRKQVEVTIWMVTNLLYRKIHNKHIETPLDGIPKILPNNNM